MAPGVFQAVVITCLLLTQSVVSQQCTELRQQDFDAGTYRITAPNTCYRIMEDIDFGPAQGNDYWNTPGDQNYPMGAYYLGFFAAITVETDSVEIDLNGKTIKQSKEFYLVQRFWDAIELADRLFVDNEGVASLNFQQGDKQQFSNNRIPGIKAASNVYIHDGTLGLSSHSGIHGNGVMGLKIENVQVKDFEVSGIHCNGCTDVEIVGCTVGPTSTQVPAQATFSNARFFGLFTQRLIPFGFSRESPTLSHLLQGTISFADRVGQVFTFQQVFDRCERAVELYRQAYMGTLDEQALSAADQALLQEARKVFSNTEGLPDGGVVYGILINHLGVPTSDENFYGAGLESSKIQIRNTVVTDLKAAPVETPAVQTVDGAYVQGVARDLLRIFDLVDDQFRTLIGAGYKGNFLADVYFAMWKLSNDFYITRVFNSPCGNFGSNSTLPYTRLMGQCTGGIPQDTSLTGRDVSMLQKKYFGGLAMSQSIYDWATTPGASLHELFQTNPDAVLRRQTKHYIQCDRDTMFHGMHGVVGIKVRYTKNVTMNDVSVSKLANVGDATHWLCSQKYKFPNDEDFKPLVGPGHMGGAAVRGIEVQKSEGVQFEAVQVTQLDSDEGAVFGIEIRGDANDQSDYAAGTTATFSNTHVRDLRGGHGSRVVPVMADEGMVNFGGVSTGASPDNHNNFRVPKALMTYGIFHAIGPGYLPVPAASNFDRDLPARMMARTTFSTEAKLKEFRKKAVNYMMNTFGLEFHEPDSTPLDQVVWVKNTNTFMIFSELADNAQGAGFSACTAADGCNNPRTTNSKYHGFFFSIFVTEPNGLMLHGSFGGDAGQLAKYGDTLVAGVYSFENFVVPGMEDNGNLEIEFFSTCPVGSKPVGNPFTSEIYQTYFDCALESKLLGNGRGSGAGTWRKNSEGNWVVNEVTTMVFDDTVVSPVAAESVRTSLYSDIKLPIPDVVYTWIGDGTYGVPDGDAGVEVFPQLFQHHMLHEAGVRYLKRWTSYNTHQKIRDLRKAFMETLRDEYGIAVADPDLYYNEPVTNQIDLGGGNTIAPYAVNHVSNQRVIMHESGTTATQFDGIDSRVHEGGFRLFVGRAGMQLQPLYGYVPYASMILQGAYVVENDPTYGAHEISFVSSAPQITNDWSTAIIEQKLTSPHLGEGIAHILSSMPRHERDGLNVHVNGKFFFENALGTFSSECLNCVKEGLYTDMAPIVPPVWPEDECATRTNEPESEDDETDAGDNQTETDESGIDSDTDGNETDTIAEESEAAARAAAAETAAFRDDTHDDLGAIRAVTTASLVVSALLMVAALLIAMKLFASSSTQPTREPVTSDVAFAPKQAPTPPRAESLESTVTGPPIASPAVYSSMAAPMTMPSAAVPQHMYGPVQGMPFTQA